MSKFDKKRLREENFVKNISRNAYEENLETFQGSKAEFYFLKFSHFVSRYRFSVFIGLVATVVIIIIIISIGEYFKYQENKAAIELEKIERGHALYPLMDLKAKIKDYEDLQQKYSLTKPLLRTSKIISDLYARNGEFTKAAELIEKAGKKIDEPKEIKAYYFYIAGNYRERSGDQKLALQNYSVAGALLSNAKKTPGFSAWSLYHSGRLRLATGDKAGAKKDLQKVLEIESDASGQSGAKSARELATFLLIKLNKG